MIYEFAFKNFSSYKSMADLLCLLRNWKIQLKYQQLRIHISYIVQSEDSFFQSEIYKNMSLACLETYFLLHNKIYD